MSDSNWSTCNLGDAMLAGESLDRITTLFLSECVNPDESEDMAVFIRHVSEGRLHCEVHVYFSPAAFRLARMLEARPCSRPSPAGLGLLAGSESSWSVLFPEGDSQRQRSPA
ncbi:MAG: hypothetical protein WBS20_17095 [Lysobacterales bacterium]